MKSNYKRIGDYIRVVDERNSELRVDELLGLSITKEFVPSVANTIGTDMSKYKIVRRNQFACSTMQVRRDKKMPVALLQHINAGIISPAYYVFEVVDEKIILPEYLMMWFTREEFDREACFYAIGGVRGSLEWEDFCDMKLIVPSIEKQKAIVKEYNTILDRIKLNEDRIKKLETLAQVIYKEWFINFNFLNSEGKPYKASKGEMIYNSIIDKDIPKGWSVDILDNIMKITRGASPRPISGYISDDKNDMPWIKISDATASITKFLVGTKEFIIEEGISKSRKVEANTLILSNSATPGLPIIPLIDACVHDGWLIFKDYKLVNKEYMYQFLKANRENIVSESNGSIFNNLKTDILKSYNIVIPNKNILDTATKLFQKIDYNLRVATCTNIILKEVEDILLQGILRIEE